MPERSVAQKFRSSDPSAHLGRHQLALLFLEPARVVLRDLEMAAGEASGPSATFVGLVYLHYARRDRLTYDFVSERLFENWREGRRAVRPEEVVRFAKQRYGPSAFGRLRESARRKIAGNVLSALRDFGVLTGTARKKIEQPTLISKAALHLWRLLYDEGLRGRRLSEASDWRLFLLTPEGVTAILAALARQGAIRFEQAGRTEILELAEDEARQ
jgi:hypothetical protein